MSSTTRDSKYPFLVLRATNEYEYRATRPGDLRLFLEAVRADLTLIPMIKQINLCSAFDGLADSGVLEFASAYDADADDSKAEETDNDEYESESDEMPIASTSEDPFEMTAQDFVLVDRAADGPPTEEVYHKLVGELLAVFMESYGTRYLSGWSMFSRQTVI